MHVRLTTIQMQPDRIDQAVAQLEEEDLPAIREINGFRGFTLLVDRKGGKVVATSYWDSKEQMEASLEAVKGPRERAAETGGSKDEPQVEQFEVALDTFVRG